MKVKDEIVISRINETDGGMVFDTKTGLYYRVNDVACFIIDCIKSGECDTEDGIAQLLCEEYDVELSVASEDTHSIIQDLLQLEIITQ